MLFRSADVRCAVLEGSDGTFCAGGDIESMLEGLASDRDTEELMEANPDLSVTVLHDGWPEAALTVLPESVTVRTGSDD